MYPPPTRKEKQEQPLVLNAQKVFTMRADAPEFHPTGQTVFACENREVGGEDKRGFQSIGLREEVYGLSPSSCQEESYYYLPDGLDLGPPGLNMTKPYRDNQASVPEHVGAPPETPPSEENEFVKYPEFPAHPSTEVAGSRQFPKCSPKLQKKRLVDRPPGIDTTSAKPIRDKSLYWSARVNRGSRPSGPRLSIAPKQSVGRPPREKQLKAMKTRRHKRADLCVTRGIERGGRKEKTNYPYTKPLSRDTGSRRQEATKEKRCLSKGLPLRSVRHKPEKKGLGLLERGLLANKNEKPKLQKRGSGSSVTKAKVAKNRKTKVCSMKKRRSGAGNAKKNKPKHRMRASTPPAQAMAMPQTPWRKTENSNEVYMNSQTVQQATNRGADNSQLANAKPKPEKKKVVQLVVKGLKDDMKINQTCATPQLEIESIDCLPINELSIQLEMILTWFVLTLERCCLVLSRFWTDSLISCMSFAFTIWYRAFLNWKQSWTFIYIYAFPFLCREIAYYVQHPVSGNALWYLYLIQDLIGAPRSRAAFCPQIIFKYGVTCGLVLLSELSFAGKYVPLPLILNSGERLVMAYLLVALKCEHFFAPSFCYRFLVAFGGLTLLAVCYGDIVVVQILILMVALYNSNRDAIVNREPLRNITSPRPNFLTRKKISSGT